jgi:hypothetical protein
VVVSLSAAQPAASTARTAAARTLT